MARAELSQPARHDLDHHWRYIARDSVGNADAWKEIVIERLVLLASQPCIGEAFP